MFLFIYYFFIFHELHCKSTLTFSLTFSFYLVVSHIYVYIFFIVHLIFCLIYLLHLMHYFQEQDVLRLTISVLLFHIV